MMPIAGIKVIDTTQAAAGPLAGQLLGDMGAEVIKVEPLSGDHFRSAIGGTWTPTVNRNKRGLAINIKAAEGMEIMLKLAKEADVFLQAFIPGVMEKLGLGYEALKKINPGIIYCSISGYGQTGPYRKRAGYDVCAQAESGLMAATGEEGGPHIRVGSSLIDYCTGTYAAYGIAMALLARQKTGRGQHIDVCLLDVAISLMSHWVTYYSLTGENPPRMGSGHVFAVPYQVFKTKDGDIFIGVQNDDFWKGFCSAFNLTDLGQNAKYDKRDDRCQYRSELVPMIQEVLMKYSNEEIKEKLEPYGIPFAPVLKVSDLMENPHVLERNTILPGEYPGLGRLKFTNNPLHMSETPVKIKRRAPQLGEHSEEILKEIGYSHKQIKELFEKKVVSGCP